MSRGLFVVSRDRDRGILLIIKRGDGLVVRFPPFTHEMINIPVPLVVSPEVSSYNVNTLPFCPVSSTHASIIDAHSSGVRHIIHTTSPPPFDGSVGFAPALSNPLLGVSLL